MKKLLLIIASLLSFTPTFANEVFPCADLWAGGSPDSRLNTNHCILANEGSSWGKDAKVYRYTDTWTNEKDQSTLMDNMIVAFEDTAKALATYGDYPNVSFILSDREHGEGTTDDATTYAFNPTKDGACTIFIYQDLLKKYSDPAFHKQAIAHEIFHCIQGKKYPKQASVTYKFAKWWIEGIAVFYSNYVYPNVYVDTIELPKYNPTIAINLTSVAYSTSSFFHSVANNFGGISAVSGIMSEMPQDPASLPVDQINALNSDIRSAGRFHQFAKEFVNNSILDFSGKALPTNYTDTTSFEDAPRAKITLDNEMEPFTFKIRKFTFKKGGKYTLRIKPDWNDVSRGTISYRKTGTKEWTDFNPYGKITADVSCTNDPISYEFLISATGEKRLLKHVTMDFDFEAMECPCLDKIAFDSCLIGKWQIQSKSVDDLFNRIYSKQSNTIFLGSSGQMFVNITSKKKSNMEIPGYDISVRQNESSTSNYYIIAVNLSGNAFADVGLPEKGKMCFRNFSGEFKNKINMTSPGWPPIESENTMPIPNEVAGPQTYSCNAAQLIIQMPMYFNGDSSPPEIINLVYDRVE